MAQNKQLFRKQRPVFSGVLGAVTTDTLTHTHRWLKGEKRGKESELGVKARKKEEKG